MYSLLESFKDSSKNPWHFGGGTNKCCSAEDNCYVVAGGGGATPTGVLDVSADQAYYLEEEEEEGDTRSLLHRHPHEEDDREGEVGEGGAWRDDYREYADQEGEGLLLHQGVEDEEVFHLELEDEADAPQAIGIVGEKAINDNGTDKGNNDLKPQLTTMKMTLNPANVNPIVAAVPTFAPAAMAPLAPPPLLPAPAPAHAIANQPTGPTECCQKPLENPSVPKTGFSVASNYRHQGASVQVKTPGDSPPFKKVVLHPTSDFREEDRSKKVATGSTVVVPGDAATAADNLSGNFQPEAPYEYALDVYVWKLTLEKRRRLSTGNGSLDVLQVQTDVTHAMRTTVLQWLVAVNQQFGFTLETWCLTVDIMDRFLAKQPINRDCLQLVGLTSFFIAAKQEEVEPPEISELVSLCARSYEAQQFRLMEYIILMHLKFELTVPTVAFFMGHLIEFGDAERRAIWPRDITRDVIEKVMCEERFSRSQPSALAAKIYDFLHRNFVMTSIVAQMQKQMLQMQQQQQLEKQHQVATAAEALQFKPQQQRHHQPPPPVPDINQNVVNNFYRMLYLDLDQQDDL